jgi:hypothetical protein
MSEHTPGPWYASPPHHGDPHKYWSVECNLPDGLPVCILASRHSGYGHPLEAEANAHLISAAPDMYEALDNQRWEQMQDEKEDKGLTSTELSDTLTDKDGQ